MVLVPLNSYDVVVIGAGWFGLSAAKTYLETHPTENLLVLDGASSFGGSWAEDRLYPGLKSNNLYGSYEHPDFPMLEEIYGVKPGQHIPAATLHRYLTDFARHFGILERTKLSTKVVHASQDAKDEWDLTIRGKNDADGKETTIHTRRLIVATGLTSEPNLPVYAGEENFTGTKFHAKDFAVHGSTVETAKRVVIVGCGKSAYDCAYAYATAPGNTTHVDLLVRPGGQGPVWLVPPYVTPFKRMLEELLHTRALTWFAPAPWGDEDGYSAPRAWLQKSGLGRLLSANWWATMSNEVIETHGFDDGNPELFKLKPWYPSFWTGSGVGIHNFDTNLWDLVRQGRIHVHTADITGLEGGSVNLSNGKVLEDIDVLCCATGWKKDATLTYNGLELRGHGLPSVSAQEQATLRQAADKEVLERFPILINQPVLRYERNPDAEPLRYYRFIVPASQVSKRNIAFAGMVSTVSTANFANAQALWISAFFDGKLVREPKSQEEVLKEVYLHTQFVKWRYPCGYGDSLPDFAFESLPYIDLLLNDVGVKNHRKQTQISELLEPYKPKDYQGLTAEWLALQGRQ
ncbi:putative dimethylaniline monooxygenase [Microdochium bolleyi]|uniref:Putative dimethylaniline monooxygenase n=1 Tax=Microdochium bolleyi TaxID=196109 RepID=A0A136IIE8_9PEZI|nr:putative dimethylaniline monooxygenase [Microdochium bolleyi]